MEECPTLQSKTVFNSFKNTPIHLKLKLRLLRCEIFSNVNDFKKNVLFSSVWLYFEKCSRKYTPISSESHKNPPPPPQLIATHPQTHREPPRFTANQTGPTRINQKPTPQPTETHCTNQKSKSKSTKSHQFRPPATPKPITDNIMTQNQ
jgi:hypothetical protein